MASEGGRQDKLFGHGVRRPTSERLPIPSRPGYTFYGWWTDDNGTGSRITNATTVTNPSDHTLYAGWKEKIDPKTTTKTKTTTITLSHSSLTLKINETAALSATVRPRTASVTWWSSNSGVATVDQSGRVTAKAPGHATITAAAGNTKVRCSVTVEAESTATATPMTTLAATPVPTPAAAPTVTPSPEAITTPAPTAAAINTPMPSPVPEDIAPAAIDQDETTGTISIEIEINSLPEGTTGIQMPDGEVIRLTDALGGKVRLEISEDDLQDGAFIITSLDDEDTPLGSCRIQVLGAGRQLDTGNSNTGAAAWVWILIGIAIVGLGIFVMLIILRKAGQKG